MQIAVNPATEEVVGEYPELDEHGLEDKLAASASSRRAWRASSFEARAAVLRRAADLLDARCEQYAALMTSEMGKPISESRGEVKKCAWVCRYYADEAEGMLEPRVIASDAGKSYVRHDPLGCVLAIMPWNFPLWQVFRAAAPALMAGNAMLLKHAPNVPGCALACEEILRDAGLPLGVFATLLLDVDFVPGLIHDNRVSAVTLTGSERAGAAVATLAGSAIKPCVLELGGSDPFIVLPDAELGSAVDGAMLSRFLNTGQSCIAAKRLLVHSDVADPFIERMAAAIDELVIGDPTLDDTQQGPLARADLRDNLAGQVTASVEAGATLVRGGRAGDGPGFFYLPTLLTDVSGSMPAACEETFGPAAVVMTWSDTDEMVMLANDTRYGLGASIWSESPNIDALAARIDAGCVAVNGITKSDPRLPFGGIKKSGYGRELSRDGILEFVNRKTVWVR